jgi:hypothetical protein
MSARRNLSVLGVHRCVAATRLSRIALLGSAVGLAGACLGVIRSRSMRWGATAEEVDRVLPGDSIAPGAGYCATRAITIDAPPELVWPWLVQLGSGRAGWYSYDRIDNGGKPSARTIVADLQGLSAGDFIPMIAGTDVGCWVKEIQPPLRMLWWDRKGDFSWEWVLSPAGAAGTRLVTRIRERYPPLFSRRMLYAIVASTGDIVMSRKQLLGIKDRAERLASESEGAVR